MTTTNMPCTINTCHHYQVLFCKKIITTWQSPPHDNHYLMTTTTTWQSPPHICQPILLGKCLLTTILSEQAILWFDLYCYSLSKLGLLSRILESLIKVGCPSRFKSFLSNFYKEDSPCSCDHLTYVRPPGYDEYSLLNLYSGFVYLF